MNLRRRILVLTASLLAVAASTMPAAAQSPVVTASATPTFGQAPLRVTLAAAGDATAYRWELGDGTIAEGAVVEHTYERAGIYHARVTATSATGETATAAVSITAAAIVLTAPRTVRYGSRATFRGRVMPLLPGTRLVITRDDQNAGGAVVDAAGEFRTRIRVRRPASYRATLGPVSSEPASPLVRPRLVVRVGGRPSVGRLLTATVRLVPRDAGRVRLRVVGSGRKPVLRTSARPRLHVRVPTTRPGQLDLRLVSIPAAGFARASHARRIGIRMPPLAPGSRGPAVRVLEERLAELRYVLRGVDGAYATDTYEAVLAFQKTHGLPRTGRATPALWRRLQRAGVPAPRMLSGTRLEVDKSRQLLLEVRGGRVVAVVHVSTGATGNTPLGRWRVYRKVTGWDWVLWYPMYFLRGFAIHGYPSVPPYPASHGCVRVPMWFAPLLYGRHPYGATVYVY